MHLKPLSKSLLRASLWSVCPAGICLVAGPSVMQLIITALRDATETLFVYYCSNCDGSSMGGRAETALYHCSCAEDHHSDNATSLASPQKRILGQANIKQSCGGTCSYYWLWLIIASGRLVLF